MMNESLLSIMACPKCNGVIKHNEMFLTCSKCKLAYPIIGDIPDMLKDDAWSLEKAEKAKFKHDKKL